MVKNGRPKSGEPKEDRESIAFKIGKPQKIKLDSLRRLLELTNAQLMEQWIDEAFRLMVDSPSAPKPQPDRAAAVLKMMIDGVKPDTLTVQQLADDLGVPSEKLAALVTKCTCHSQEEKSHAKSKA